MLSLSGPKELKYECATTKKLCMSRVVLKKKGAGNGNSVDAETDTQDHMKTLAEEKQSPK